MSTATLDRATSAPAPASHLWGRWLDAGLLGGFSILAFVALQWARLSAAQTLVLAGVMMGLAHVVNHPHFAHSYQIFYRAWRTQRTASERGTRWRWWWAGGVAPLLLAAVLGAAAWRASVGDPFWMGLSISGMALLVGWHYVKQGFGMVMTDAALQRCWWPQDARRALLANAYVCWATGWVLVNTSEVGRSYWGYFSWQPQLPTAAVGAVAALCLLSTLRTALVVARAMREMAARQPRRALPWAGLLAYAVTLYLWTVFAAADPVYMLVIPFFHSLQYLAVVWRFQVNAWRAEGGGPGLGRPLRFLAIGIVLGAMGFWWVPVGLESLRSGLIDFDPQGPALAVACFWLFINVHHYLIDNVLWRKDNPIVNRHLFGHVGA